MLDTETKRKIDACRDILVGKVPDPKSQVEQITIALIYKFMDDMDKQSEEWGGKATFFTGEYAKYTWSKIFDPRLGGFDLIALYGDALVKMNHNPNIPQLFRDIFKNAYLPYRSPETLKSFLKQINEFTYDHSERLGDAFEYLLSVLSSQGDAGQFRTPRHIIDFIVQVVDPKKNETVLDPACGTAGFLISSYRHILKANTKKKNGDKLTPTEKKRLMNNFMGYDISPDMVRLSLVNMYLHGFPKPNIHEYDTLSSEERWDETADVILANPPFMTPKGGIRPHKRFSIQAKRSEVLFVDYMAEHLNPNGRVGVIVPEGIIFQSQNAYKQLRKMLVENYLWCVVSMPAGVFNPYSGVKTSILLMDKTLAKKTDKILFVKIENDGFDLGAQRRQIDKNDLPKILKIIKQYQKEVVISYIDVDTDFADTDFARAVEKKEIAESGDWNLSGERYRDKAQISSAKYEMVELGEIINLDFGTRITKKNDEGTQFPVYGGGGESFRTDNYNREDELVISRFAMSKECVRYVKEKFFLLDSGFTYSIKREITEKIYKPFLDQVFLNIQEYIYSCARGHAQKNLDVKQFKKIKIPLPPLSVQEEVVAEIDGYQKITDGARQVVDNYKPIIKIDPDWPMVALGEVMEVNAKTIDPVEQYGEKEFVYIDITSVENGTGVVSFDNRIRGVDAPSRARRVVRNRDVLLSTVRPNLKAFGYLSNVPENAIASTGFAVLTASDKVVPQFVYYQLFGEYLQKQMIRRMGKGAYPSINQKDVQELQFPLLPLSVQKEIVAEIEAEQQIVNDNKKLIESYEQKVKNKIAEIWGEK